MPAKLGHFINRKKIILSLKWSSLAASFIQCHTMLEVVNMMLEVVQATHGTQRPAI